MLCHAVSNAVYVYAGKLTLGLTFATFVIYAAPRGCASVCVAECSQSRVTVHSPHVNPLNPSFTALLAYNNM